VAHLERSIRDMRFVITSVDYAPDELNDQTPIRGRILRQIAGPDRPDYHVAELDRQLKWKKEGAEVSVTHIVLTARWVGGVLAPTMKHTPVNIAYVVDQSVLSDALLDFGKCAYTAIGVADGEPEESKSVGFLQKVSGWIKK
jgi:hypothetical protein